jgi:hypothetical protein
LSAELRWRYSSPIVPTVLRAGPYRIFFYAGDRLEPPHVHVERESDRAKVWLDPVRLQESGGFRRSEIARILDLVRAHEAQFLRAWNEYFTD